MSVSTVRHAHTLRRMVHPSAIDHPSDAAYRLPVYRVELVHEKPIRSRRSELTKPAQVAALFHAVHPSPDRELLVVICLDTKQGVRGINTVSMGDLSSSIATPREIFKPAILTNAASIILIHNHPSGDPTPSHDDITVTRRIVQAGTLIGIELIDHVIVGDPTYVSLKERGYL